MRHKISRQGIEELIKSEGLRLEIYRDSAGYPTIGIGHLLTRPELFSGKRVMHDGSVLDLRKGITKEQAFKLMKEDLIPAESTVNDLVTVPLNQHQFDALVIFVYNIGDPAFCGSTLLRLLNSGDYDSVPVQMKRWTKAGGKQSKGLVNRRKNTIKVWEGSMYTVGGDPFRINSRSTVGDYPAVIDLKPEDQIHVGNVHESEILRLAEALNLI